MMADLPAERPSYGSPPFFNGGMDYFGPFYVSVNRSSEKCWGFLFTCLTTRALHIECVPSIDMNSCVLGNERFIAWREKTLVLWSDTGTNFIATEKELYLCIQSWNQKFLASQMSERGILWHFNPPSAPHSGGSGEGMVKSVKRTLYAVLGNRRHTDVVLQTTFYLVESTLNNRPLTPVSSDPTELAAITPNHFLLGHRSCTVPSLLSEEDFDHRKRYVRAQCYVESIWKMWLAEFVPNLNRRSKWSTLAKTELKSGHILWVAD